MQCWQVTLQSVVTLRLSSIQGQYIAQASNLIVNWYCPLFCSNLFGTSNNRLCCCLENGILQQYSRKQLRVTPRSSQDLFGFTFCIHPLFDNRDDLSIDPPSTRKISRTVSMPHLLVLWNLLRSNFGRKIARTTSCIARKIWWANFHTATAFSQYPDNDLQDQLSGSVHEKYMSTTHSYTMCEFSTS